MKKYFLSVTVVILFVAYIAYERTLMPNAQTPITVQDIPLNTATSSLASTPIRTVSLYKDGSYTGKSFNNYYGNIQVQVEINGGKLTGVKFLQYPKDQKESVKINTQAMPQLISEAITAQSSKVDVVSGATDSSESFIESLTSAISQAKS